MDYETDEQQLEAIKRWWSENGRSVILGVALGALAIVGWQGYGKYKLGKAEEASDGFSATLDALQGESDVVEKAAAVKESGGMYAVMAGLAAARALVESGDLPAAIKELKWAVSETDSVEVKTIASIRLARVLNANGKPDDALAALPTEVFEGFTGLVEEARGDIYFAQGDQANAREAYQKALDSGQRLADANVLTMKLDDLATPDSDPQAIKESS